MVTKIAVDFHSFLLLCTAAIARAVKFSNAAIVEYAGCPSSLPGLRNDTAGSVPLAASAMNWLLSCWVFARSAGLVMIDDEYCIGSQMPQYFGEGYNNGNPTPK